MEAGALKALRARAAALYEASVEELVPWVQQLLRWNEKLQEDNGKLQEDNEKLHANNTRLEEEIGQLREEIALLKKVPDRPKVPPASGGVEGGGRSGGLRRKPKRRGPKRRRKRAQRVRIGIEDPPPGAVHKDYQSYYVQSLHIEVRHTIYERQRMQLPDGSTITAPLPEGVIGSFNAGLHRFVLGLYHQAQSTIPRIVGVLSALGLEISSRQVRRILTAGKKVFTDEAADILEQGLGGALWISVDDTGARHEGNHHICTSIGNTHFAWFGTARSKSRLSFLNLMCGKLDDYLLDSTALRYIGNHRIAPGPLAVLTRHAGHCVAGSEEWSEFLDRIGVSGTRSRRIATEGARLGALFAHGLLRDDTAILSDGAGQFDIGLRQFLCWVHEERLYRKLPAWSVETRAAIDNVRSGIWRTYRLLRAYRRRPTPARRAAVERRFERTFQTGTGIESLDSQIRRSLENTDKLLAVVDHPHPPPLHNNQRENDIRANVRRRKISGGTRSENGRICRDAFLTLMKTCQRHNISFWDYLGDRLHVPGARPIPHLPPLARQITPLHHAQ